VDNYTDALFWTRMLSIGSTFIPIFFLHWILLLIGKVKAKKFLLSGGYLITAIFLFFSFSPLFIKTVEPRFGFPFWPVPGILYHFYVVFSYISLLGYGIYQLFIYYHQAAGHLRAQMKYIFLGLAIAAPAGFSNFPLWYGINIPPYLNLFVLSYMGCYSYVMLKYRLMDIRVAIGKGAVYILSLLTAIGVSFLLMFLNNRLVQPVRFEIFLPLSVVVSILFYHIFFRLFEKVANRYFYYTFYSYQKVLSDLGRELIKVLDLKKLSSLVVETLQVTMKLDRTVVLLRGEDGRFVILKNIGFMEENGISLVRDNFLTDFLKKIQKPLVFEELVLAERDAASEYEKVNLHKLQDNMKKIEAIVCLPLFAAQEIIGLVVLGKKISGDAYSQEDLELLSALASQVSVALQNARLYDQVQSLTKKLQNQVEGQTKDIKALSEMKTEFLKVVNHQLRTPISIIKGMSSMLYEGDVAEKDEQDFKRKMYLSAERLSVILDDILIAQSLVAGSEEPDLSPCNVLEIVERRLEHFQPQAQERNIQLVFQKPSQVIPSALLDEQMFEKIISHLIDNAILYTKTGEVSVSLEAKKTASGQDVLELKVQDTGMGLDEETKAHLFELFYRGQQAIHAHPNGSGLGLYIVKEFVKAQKGEIAAQSDGLDKGSTFTVRLPIVEGVE